MVVLDSADTAAPQRLPTARGGDLVTDLLKALRTDCLTVQPLLSSGLLTVLRFFMISFQLG